MNIILELLNALFGGKSNAVTPPDPVIPSTTPEVALLDLINRFRHDHGLNSLTVNAKLMAASSKFAKDLYVEGYFDHNGRDGSTPFTRITAEGYYFTYAGECLAMSASPSEAFNLLINDPPHYEIIVGPHFTDIGIGILGNRYVIDFGATS